jgi:phage tail sheath protein FI
MPFQLSPGVLVTEKDLTTVVPAVATSIGAIAGMFVWGPVNKVTTVASENELVQIFGKPDATVAQYWFSAANFLAYANNLKVVRVVNTGAKNAVCSGTAVLIQNEDEWEASYQAGEANVGPFAAKYPGAIGNGLLVSMADGATFSGTAGTGTIAYTTNSKTVTGTGTEFLTQLHIGAVIKVGATTIGAVESIASDTELTLRVASRVTATGQSFTFDWAYAAYFDTAPGTSDQAALVGGSNDELHIVVVDKTGVFTGTPNTVLEKFAYVSKASDAKSAQGENNYYKSKLTSSKYVWWMNHVTGNWGTAAAATAFTQLTAVVQYQLTGGLDGNAITDEQLITGYNLFADAESVDINLLIGGPANATVALSLIDIAEARKDCLLFLSPPLATVRDEGVEGILTYKNTTLNPNTSYAVMDSGWKYQYDRYNDVYRWVPLNADVAGLCARTDNIADPWYSPGGFNRGVVKGVVKLCLNPTKTQRDELYKNGINPVVSFAGEGTVLWGDKTLLKKPSAFDHINVRRLFIVLEKAIATAAKFQLFEFNDAFTRAQFRNLVEPFLRDVKGRRGIIDFMVVCDDTNNTGEVIDRNEFVADIFIKPTRSINFINLNFVATRTSVSFDEVIGA